ncbi:hypothetical protein NMG60_11006491 [Bertholletia excelsa]
MAPSIKCVFVLTFMVAAASSIRCTASSTYSLFMSSCPPQFNAFICDLRFQCPRTIAVSLPVEVDGESLDKAMSSGQTKAHTAVLFYSSWCPFSTGVHIQFVVLSTMFPQIGRIMVEQSLVMPTVLSRYGIHSMPSILIVKQTARIQYHGPKDLYSFVQFYKRTTGLELVVDLTEDQGILPESDYKSPDPRRGNSIKQMFRGVLCLIFSVLFILARLFLYFFPKVVSRLNALQITYTPHQNVGIFRVSRQLFSTSWTQREFEAS